MNKISKMAIQVVFLALYLSSCIYGVNALEKGQIFSWARMVRNVQDMNDFSIKQDQCKSQLLEHENLLALPTSLLEQLVSPTNKTLESKLLKVPTLGYFIWVHSMLNNIACLPRSNEEYNFPYFLNEDEFNEGKEKILNKGSKLLCPAYFNFNNSQIVYNISKLTSFYNKRSKYLSAKHQYRILKTLAGYKEKLQNTAGLTTSEQLEQYIEKAQHCNKIIRPNVRKSYLLLGGSVNGSKRRADAYVRSLVSSYLLHLVTHWGELYIRHYPRVKPETFKEFYPDWMHDISYLARALNRHTAIRVQFSNYEISDFIFSNKFFPKEVPEKIRLEFINEYFKNWNAFYVVDGR